jgi:hypothetical protein
MSERESVYDPTGNCVWWTELETQPDGSKSIAFKGHPYAGQTLRVRPTTEEERKALNEFGYRGADWVLGGLTWTPPEPFPPWTWTPPDPAAVEAVERELERIQRIGEQHPERVASWCMVGKQVQVLTLFDEPTTGAPETAP